jgi:tRNA nucleotidyltransferase (CCA-adding enzyme)
MAPWPRWPASGCWPSWRSWPRPPPAAAAWPGTAAALAPLEELTPERATAAGLTAEEQQAALPLARLAAVLDAAALRRLRSSRQWQQRVEALRHWQQRLGASADGAAAAASALPERERLSLQRQLEADLPALLVRWPAHEARAWLGRWRNPHDPLFHPRPAIDGHSLQQELGLRPSRELGALLEHLMLERAFGRLQGRSDALREAQKWLESAAARSGAAPRRD